ncbi:MAG: BON domain-containing protein [gamma proteobacterium symbiont of Bathyaustriella thionipta]|nr:BON domain-containing protein [gamma proteobacterium symbiont of Bathyaustriella thionipta]
MTIFSSNITNRTSGLYLLLFTVLLHGCTGAVIGGSATGATVANDQRSSGTMLDDQNIEFRALNIYADHPELNDVTSMSTTSINGIALLTGEAPTEAQRDLYVQAVARIPNVKRVINEIALMPPVSIESGPQDSYITAKVKVALYELELPDFHTSDIKVVTTRGIVYLMGIVTKEQAQAVVNVVRHVDGVKRVVKVFEYR